MANIFNSYSGAVPRKNHFNLSHTCKTTADFGLLVPVLVQDVLPNDTFKLSMSSLIRFAPLIAPMMSEVDVYFHAFFVPERIVWDATEDFFTGAHKGRALPSQNIPERPRMFFNNGSILTPENANLVDRGILVNSLADYLGFQTAPAGSDPEVVELDEMPFRVYQKIWSDYYMDENLSYLSGDQTVTDILEEVYEQSGVRNVYNTLTPDVTQLMRLRYRAWKKDYFTSALPFAQKGDDILIPGSGGATSFTNGRVYVAPERGDGYLTPFGLSPTSGTPALIQSARGGRFGIGFEDSEEVMSLSELSFNPTTLNAYLNSGQVDQGTIRDLRRAMAAQRWLERKAVGGSRYQEQNLAMFGIRGSDARLQRAEFLGGIKNPVVVSQVLQTSETTGNSPQGNPSGNAISAGAGFIFRKTFEEYGWIMVLMSVLPKADYIQGTPRMYMRKDIYDFYWPQFAHIGEQPIYKGELYTEYNSDGYGTDGTGINGTNYGTFGYTPRYAEYRFRNNRIHGDFRESLQYWTLARDFSEQPTLNGDFVSARASNRVFAVPTSNYRHLWCDIAFRLDALRPIPKYAENL
ncbi:major capsid protein [Peromfec virus RodF8_47]|uniref:Major capsid protein n=1 Tax=Peromfec virus RodF8_47 TaxID=2929378 RepID=A0A976R8S2_9VIRU|nr:major capsid protein [Peromfec virus RodF8_47]